MKPLKFRNQPAVKRTEARHLPCPWCKKVGYPSRRLAKAAIGQIKAKRGSGVQRAYPCSSGNGLWHLTSEEKRSEP